MRLKKIHIFIATLLTLTLFITPTLAAPNDSSLSNIEITEGELSPEFSAGNKTYSVEIPSSTTSIQVTPTATDSNVHSITVNGYSVTTGSQSDPITMNTGDNTITINVTSQDQTSTSSYILTVHKDIPPSTKILDWQWDYEYDQGPNETYIKRSLCADQDGNAYVIGESLLPAGDINFGTEESPVILTFTGAVLEDFLLKYNSQGQVTWGYVYSTGQLQTCITDSDNNLYIGGSFSGTTDLDFTSGTHEYTASGTGDGFLTKYDSDGNYDSTLIFASSDVNRSEYVQSVAFSGTYMYVLGAYFGGDFDVDGTAGVDNLPNLAHGDIFISKYQRSTGAYVDSVAILGPNEHEVPFEILADDSDNIYIGGYWVGVTMDFDPTAGEDIKTGTDTKEIFLTKFDSTLAYQWTRVITQDNQYSNYWEEINDMEFDADQNILLVGNTDESTRFGTAPTVTIEGSGSYTPAIQGDGFLVKYLTDGTVDYVGKISTSGSESIESILSINNQYYLVGYFDSQIDLNTDTSEESIYDPARGDGKRNIFISTIDNNLDFQNAFVSNLRAYDLVSAIAFGEDVYLWMDTLYAGENPNFTYEPQYLNSTGNDGVLLIKYSEIFAKEIINTPTNYMCVEDERMQDASDIYFSPNDTVTTNMEYWDPNIELEIEETTSSNTYQANGALFNTGDDDYWSVNLPFTFPFYDKQYTSLTIGNNGIVCMDTSYDCSWYPSSLDDTYYGPFIAPLASDLQTDQGGEQGVYIESSSEKYVITWKAQEYGEDLNTVEFSLVLYPNGEFEFLYGPQPNPFTYSFEVVIGVGNGDGENYTIGSQHGRLDFNNQTTVKWLPSDGGIISSSFDLDMTRNKNLENYSADYSFENKSVFVEGITNIEGSTNHSLYVPYTTEQISRVILCPYATNIAEVSLNCTGAQSISLNSSDVSTFTYFGKNYIRVDNTNIMGIMASANQAFRVIVSDNDVIEGDSVDITIAAIDNQSNVDTTYTGTITLTGLQGLPSTYTFTQADLGSHTFSDIEIDDKGTYTVTAKDSVDTSVLGVATINAQEEESPYTPPYYPLPEEPEEPEEPQNPEEPEDPEEEEDDEEERGITDDDGIKIITPGGPITIGDEPVEIEDPSDITIEIPIDTIKHSDPDVEVSGVSIKVGDITTEAVKDERAGVYRAHLDLGEVSSTSTVKASITVNYDNGERLIMNTTFLLNTTTSSIIWKSPILWISIFSLLLIIIGYLIYKRSRIEYDYSRA